MTVGSHQQETIETRRQHLSSIPRAVCVAQGDIMVSPELSLDKNLLYHKEEQIENLKNRLEIVEDQLANQNSSISPAAPLTSSETPIQIEREAERSTDQLRDLYEGSSSFTSQSIQAKEVAETVTNANRAETGLSISTTLKDLDRFLRCGDTVSHKDQVISGNTTCNLQSTSLPLPAGLVLAILHRIHEQFPVQKIGGG
ncbi:hypothetical protein BGW36DRAFT_358380 [Talaromyces proteolyticus]|uniref:Uncharacterized protein n=1 Tax=Talaromyces proteolyticus TaxID=1131652 RepID=A0AAD4KTA6_9EURO|nr:uncharacterized protein BGW36DRAFT_358380 [Talaromyces proteolyticus]KAH8698866.1 hypothetical protein BGW36DRAFT_358380 [Talaromyces proteolyticus]